MPFYKATIDVLVDAENYYEACDAIAEGMRPLLREYALLPAETAWIDWRYAASGPVPDSGEGFELADERLTR